MNSQGCTADTTEPFALRVIGSSMYPEFKDGNIIIVDPGHPLINKAYVVIEFKGEILFGQFIKENNLARLTYLNEPNTGIPLDEPFTLKGVVTQRSNGRRKDLKHYNYMTD